MADNPAPIIQEIIIRQQGVDAANRAIGDLATRERDAGRAAADAGRATDAAARATTRAGQAARDAGRSIGDNSGLWDKFKRSVGGANEGLGKITQGVQLVGGALGALVGGGVIGGAITAAISAFGDLADIITDEDGRLRRNAEAVNILSAAYRQFAIDAAKAADQASAFRSAQFAGARDRAAGLGISPDAQSASGFLEGAAQGEADLKRRNERNRLEAELLRIRSAIADKEAQAADMGLPSFRRDQARGQLIDLRAAQESAKAQYDALRIAVSGVEYSRRGGSSVVRARLGDTGPAFGPANLDFGPVDNPGERARLAARDEALQQERYALQSAGVDARSALSSGNKEPAKAVESQLQGLATTAADTTSIAIGAFNQLTAAFGQAMAQMVISGELGAGGLRKSLGRIIGGVSETLFTYGTLASLLAIASPLSGGLIPGAGLGPVAAGLFAGAVATGLIARSLGAGASAGGAGGRVAGAGAGGVGGGGVAPVTNISINLGISSRAVHDAVVQESSNLAGARGQRRVAVERAA